MIGRLVRRALTAAAGIALFSAVTVLGLWPEATAAGSAEIVIDNFAFEPAVMTVAPGTAVTWVNRDEEPHTVVSAAKELRFKSQALDTNDKFSFVFDKPGTYKYFCSVHSHMVGTIEVK